MSEIICVTNRKLCGEEFLLRIEKIASTHPAEIILREKDLSEAEYRELAEQVLTICRRNGTPCILHNFVDAAKALRSEALHLPLPVLRALSGKERAAFSTLGASCHSAEEAIEAEKLGCTYITAGHIFDTDCKKGTPGRGLNFLKKVCGSVSIPVYAIGGIGPGNIAEAYKAGAAGACVMSGLMQCENVEKYLLEFEVNEHEI